jgi:hypothetical protein
VGNRLDRFTDDIGRDISVFHAYDCENGEDYWFGIDRSIREAYYRKLAQIVAKQKELVGIAFCAEIRGWDRIATPEFRERYQTPYALCAEHCFQAVSAYEKMKKDRDGVALTFAEHQEYSDRIDEIFRYYMKHKAWSSVKSLTFSSPKTCRPLQCADMISYEAYRYWGSIERGGLADMADRPAWRIIADAGHFERAACYGGHGLINAVRRFHAMQRLPDPYPD